MITHRFHLPHYHQVAIYVWPILFFQLWRVDRWQDETGRRAFVIPDKYGRAWVRYFEGMSQKPHVNGMHVQAYKPDDIDQLCPGWLERATFPALDASVSWGLRPAFSLIAFGAFKPWTPAYAGISRVFERLEPG
ncbi:MAG: hypothetical protein AAF437_13840 [Pseudomonadota bacterium]